MLQLWTDILGLLKAPLTKQLDTLHLFLLIGLTLVFIAAWLMILRHIKGDIAEVV